MNDIATNTPENEKSLDNSRDSKGLAEGEVSAPLLSAHNNGRKGGFATFRNSRDALATALATPSKSRAFG